MRWHSSVIILAGVHTGGRRTPLYMAPEVIMHGEITTKVDVYAFGIVLWEILTRTEAFPHHNDLHKFATAVCRRHERPVCYVPVLCDAVPRWGF